MNNSNFFFCYNIRLASHLIESGFRFITKAYTKEGKPFYLYENTKELTESIQAYRDNKKSGINCTRV